MHYYQFNIGDYASHTSRLNIYEDLAYRRLLDLYYLSERPLNGCSKDVAREIGMQDSLGDVEFVLQKFFTEKNNAWHNKRCDRDIKTYKAKQKSAKKAGIASGIARKRKGTDVERTLNEKETTDEPTNNHKPITINQEPKIKTRASPFVVPEEIDLMIWADFEQHRKDIRKPLKDLARVKNANILKALNHDQQRICVDKSISSGWAGLFPPKEQNNGQQTITSRAKQHQDKLREIAERDIEQNGFADTVG